MENLRIIGFDVSNFKRISLWKCRLETNKGLVTIGGENANGKTSLLDALYCALVNIPRNLTNPIKEGEDSANIRILIGSGNEAEYKVIRTFTRGGQPSIKVIGPGDKLVNNSRELLLELLGSNGIDPVAFLNLQPKEQRDQLAKLVGLDMADFDAQIEESRIREKQLDERQKSLLAKVEDLPWHNDAPESLLDASKISARISEAAAHNAKVNQLRSNLHVAQIQHANAKDEVDRAIKRKTELEAEIAALDASIQTSAVTLNEKLEAIEKAENDLQEFKAVDVEPLHEQIANIERENMKVRDNEARLKAAAEWEQAEKELGEQTEKSKSLQAAKKKALSEAKFPVEGLAFDSQAIIYNGQPFSQASAAERIRVAVSIALAQRGKVAPIIIRDASTLDNESLKIIEEMAEKHGAQVFAEIVANPTDDGWDKDCTFYVVDGQMQEGN